MGMECRLVWRAGTVRWMIGAQADSVRWLFGCGLVGLMVVLIVPLCSFILGGFSCFLASSVYQEASS